MRSPISLAAICASLASLPDLTYAFSTVVAGASTAAGSLSATATAALPTPEESAKALSDYMAKAHEDKIRAVNDAEDRSRARIQELEEEVADLKAKLASPTVGGVSNESDGSYAFPATNKAQAEKIAAYQNFVASYVVDSSIEKVRAVKDAEDKLRANYEEKIANLLAAKKNVDGAGGSD
mmetsp:Transcript_11871/g.25695  ORF Transcript_11871/g.25695 Transcript_11871/m.25695 type:complete len:180 (+) Transcript_11871:66-605(+)